MAFSIFKRVGLGVGLATLLVIAVGLFLPRTYTIERSIVIAAPQNHIHELCGNLEEWPRWTPWFKADPGLEISLGNRTSGEGAAQSWQGKGSRGRLTFTRSDPAWGIGALADELRDRLHHPDDHQAQSRGHRRRPRQQRQRHRRSRR